MVRVVLVGERGEKLSLVLSAPSEEEECPLSMDKITQDGLGFLETFSKSTGSADWNQSATVFYRQAPTLRKLTMPCGHSFGALHLVYNFALNNMLCPCCRSGVTTRLRLSSLPGHLHKALRDVTRAARECRQREEEEENRLVALHLSRQSDWEQVESLGHALYDIGDSDVVALLRVCAVEVDPRAPIESNRAVPSIESNRAVPPMDSNRATSAMDSNRATSAGQAQQKGASPLGGNLYDILRPTLYDAEYMMVVFQTGYMELGAAESIMFDVSKPGAAESPTVSYTLPFAGRATNDPHGAMQYVTGRGDGYLRVIPGSHGAFQVEEVEANAGVMIRVVWYVGLDTLSMLYPECTDILGMGESLHPR